MTDAALYEEDALDSMVDAVDELEEAADALDELEAFGDDTDAFEDVDALEKWDAFEEAGHEWDALLEGDDGLDEFGDFALDGATGLYVPRSPGGLITGPTAVALGRQLNPFVLESLDADDADAFFRRIGRALRRVGRGIARGARRVGGFVRRAARAAAPLLRRIGPLLRRALPMIQRVAGLAGPWGRLIAGGIGAIRGLAEGRGLRGALAGALSGVIPGVGGRLASAVLGGDGADDDAALDALADMADARQVSPVVALPVGAGLAARVVTPRSAGRVPAAIAPNLRAAERTMLRAASAAGGSAGRRLRVLRAIARLARSLFRRHGGFVSVIAVPAAVRTAARTVLARVRQRPAAGVSRAAAAARRVAARRAILNRIPVSAMYPGFAPARV